MYTDKTVKQCLSAINDRLHQAGTASRPAMDGWIEKGGRFSMSMSTTVAKRFNRMTKLQGTLEREDKVTIVRGHVPDGLSREGQALVFGVMLVLGLIVLSRGNAILAILVVAVAAAMYVPFRGDYENSTILIKELRKILNAKDRPPKRTRKK